MFDSKKKFCVATDNKISFVIVQPQTPNEYNVSMCAGQRSISIDREWERAQCHVHFTN